MPLGDGTGPLSSGPGTGRRRGGGQTGGASGANRPGRGPGGTCVCPACGAGVAHQAGTPCTNVHCPHCGTRMVRG